jgi:hypothetical protein
MMSMVGMTMEFSILKEVVMPKQLPYRRRRSLIFSMPLRRMLY